MNDEQIREIADAILYEGYLLYPYRHSSIKNQQRWTFGVVYPRSYSETQGINEPWQMRTECLIAGSAETELDVTMRFLHLLKHTTDQEEKDAGGGYQGYEIWEEGRAREIAGQNLSLHELVVQAKRIPVSFAEEYLAEPGQDTFSPSSHMDSRQASPTTNPLEQEKFSGKTKHAQGTIRVQRAIEGAMTISAEQVKEGLFKITVLIENTSAIKGNDLARMEGGQDSRPRQDYKRGAVQLHSFVSTHTILQVQQGDFISLLEPPDELADIAKSCQNTHTWPVLIGHEGERDTMLSSPIILYDYPQIAPESIGTLFDGTEIDEILTLRIMTLTDEEKQEMRKGDERVNALLERTEALTADDLMSLHGVIRNLHSVDEEEVNR